MLVKLIDTFSQQDTQVKLLSKSKSMEIRRFAMYCFFIDCFTSTQWTLGMLSKLQLPRRNQYTPDIFLFYRIRKFNFKYRLLIVIFKFAACVASNIPFFKHFSFIFSFFMARNSQRNFYSIFFIEIYF